MQTKIIFDAVTKPFMWSHAWAAAGAFAFGCVIILLKKLGLRRALSQKWGYFMIVAALVAICYDSAHWYTSRRSYLHSLTSGKYQVLEGPVENFHPMPDDGGSEESFSIAGHSFSYSDDEPAKTTTCFNQTRLHGGPIHPDLKLRVRFVDNCILEIEALPQEFTPAKN